MPETHDYDALGRCLYEQFNQVYFGAKWSELTLLESRLWRARAENLIKRLDALGYRMTYFPPES